MLPRNVLDSEQLVYIRPNLGPGPNDLTTSAAAWWLGVTRQTVWKWRQGGLLAGYYVGSRWRASLEELERFKKRIGSASKAGGRPTFREISAEILGVSRTGLWHLEKKIGRKVTPSALAEMLKARGREEGRMEMYEELRRQRRLKYPKVAAAAKRRVLAQRAREQGVN